MPLQAHRSEAPGPPELEEGDLRDLERALERIRSGEIEGKGFWPREYIVNDTITILAEPRILQDW